MPTAEDAGGWLGGARRTPSPNCDSRPAGAEIRLVAVHAISLPRGRYGRDGGGSAIERLFTNRLDPAAHPSFAGLARLRVSAHFLLYRDGELVQFVPLQARAWHAGVSRWRGRERCNDISVGIELEGVDDAGFARAQYDALAGLIIRLRALLPLRAVAGHSDLAPGRKTDPGAGFDWPRLHAALARS
ncbi:MAG: 1,6-anhydro-N-acetylmuramyl-L-alanine amidase AmpD [Burkholderiales bacterium]|nr:1,6-anhydro-N-acetylmuramyl-L-alanine amidase AmpD [Burkholderiales bacterium]